MKRYVMTGAPGAGKTAIIRQLELDGFGVVEEAATDIIALWQAKGIREPWTQPEFIDAIVGLQQSRERRSACFQNAVQFHDRSVVCTAALADYSCNSQTPESRGKPLAGPPPADAPSLWNDIAQSRHFGRFHFVGESQGNLG